MPEHLPLPEDPTAEPAPADNAPTAAAAAAVTEEPVAQPAAVAAPGETPAPQAVEPAGPAIPELAPPACAARLAELFPAVFTLGAAKPLKLRIQADIQQRAPGIFTKKSLSIFLHRHTTSTAYLKALVSSPQRVDLDGQPAGDVADEHRAAATEELDRRRGLHAVRRAAERDAQRKLIEAQRKAGAEGRRVRAPDAATGAALDAVPGAQAGAIDAAGADAGPVRGADRPHRPEHRHEHRHEQRGTPAGHPQRQAPGRPDGPRGGPAHSRGQGEERKRPAREPAHGPARGGPHRPARGPAAEGAAQAWNAAAPQPAVPDDPARRERWLLLRAYETSTLTKANFCALKRLTEVQLDELLAQARQDEPARQEPVRRDGPAHRPPRPAGPRGAAPGITPPAEAPPQRKAPRR